MNLMLCLKAYVIWLLLGVHISTVVSKTTKEMDSLHLYPLSVLVFAC